ncbi:hypothetical protein N7461_002097 [Penicillium sp. DV-2018c]|nr:hypothetical protein N7461_002097 [Penicillium sp. DV-2018c]
MRPTYPDVATFSGEDLKEYDVFQLKLRTKLEMDGHFYSTPSRQVLCAFRRPTRKASQRMLPWMRANGTDTSPYSLEKFWKEMERAFGDADRKQQALVRLHRSKQ